MSRGVDRTETFFDDDDRRSFLAILGSIVTRGALIIHAFCLMPNHFHLLAETPLAGLSRWMQLLLGDYAQRFNRRHRRIGHLFQGRYKALLVEDGEYFLECSRYIHLNPNRAEMTRPAELYPWSSYRNFVGGPCVVDWVATERTLEFFQSSDHYRAFVESGRDERPVSPFERAKAGLVLGGERFVEGVKRLLEGSSHDHGAATLQALARTQGGPPAEAVREAVRRVFADLSPCRRRRLEMFALERLTPLSMKEIGDAVGTSASAVSKACKAIGSRLAEEEGLARDMRLVAGLLQSETASVASAPPLKPCPDSMIQGKPLRDLR